MRISRVTVGLMSLALALAVSLPALAQTSSTPSSPAAPSQAAPAPGASAQPSAPANSNQNHAQSQTADDNPLNLTEEQKAKLRPIIMEENQQMEALRNDNSLSQEQKIQKANQIRADASPKIKAVLTPEQLQKLAQMQQERARENQSAPPSNSQSPQK